jgi:hypothetical protein
MKPKHIEVGNRYVVRFGRELLKVYVDKITVNTGARNSKESRFYHVIVLGTHERLVIKSPTKFKRELGLPRFDFDLGKIVFGEEK